MRLPFVHRLIEVINEPPGQLYLIFEFIDKDLKKYIDKVEGPLPMPLVKVRVPTSGHRASRR